MFESHSAQATARHYIYLAQLGFEVTVLDDIIFPGKRRLHFTLYLL